MPNYVKSIQKIFSPTEKDNQSTEWDKVRIFSTPCPTCMGLSVERLSFEISKGNLSKDNVSKDGPAQFGSLIELWDTIPESSLSRKQVVTHPSKHNLHKCNGLGPESTV